ncbi:MAG: 2Fe-2S iron-sulfur cluster binding domain-containing protein [Rhodospirillales bacterium]|nr:2Fe-2S iron-sulfur cluster binding domain-containing protein [Rhodospirillales bacterium]
MSEPATIRLEPSGDSFVCNPGETILRAGLAAGFAMPYECASGSCSSCKGRLLEGAVEHIWPDATGLSERDRRKGDRILCCQALPQGDVTVQVRLGEVEGARKEQAPAPFKATVETLERLVPGVIAFSCRPAQPVPFLPGQYVLLQVPGGERRAFSMANTEAETLDFIVKEKPGGHASRYLFDELAAGDTVSLEGPYGRAYLRTPPVREIVCVAGGSGLAPILSVAKAAIADPDTPAVRLFFGANAAEELFMVDEMQALAAAHDRLSLTLAVRDGAPGAATGLVGDVALAAMEDLDDCDFYMAGPPGLIDAILRPVMRCGKVKPERIFFDRFF